MRVIYVDPFRQTVEERDVRPTLPQLQSLCNGSIAPHYIVPQILPDHVGLVDEEGLIKNKIVWFFANTMIWGPMVIMGMGVGEHKPAKVSIEQVKRYVLF